MHESTRTLDSESEHHIKVALKHLMKGRNCFKVAQRLSTIKSSDQIIVMASDGIYVNLIKLQNTKIAEVIS